MSVVYPKIFKPDTHEDMSCSQKLLMLVWRYHNLLSWFLANGHFPQVSRQSQDMNDNELKHRALTHLMAFTLGLRLTPENFSQERAWSFCDHSRLKWGPLLPNDICSVAQSWRKREQEGK